MSIHDQIVEVINDLNITVDQNGTLLDVDSIIFLTLIVRIEETFSITFPDEFLNLELVQDLNKLETIVCNLLGEEKDENN